jgi:sugar (pentulose or hexulose) kinase
VQSEFGQMDLDLLGRQAADCLPTRRVVYPLTTQGERFPFLCPSATGFGLQDVASPAERFAAGMEAVAFLELLGIERFESLGLRIADTVYATGGGTAGETWLRIRASVNNRTYAVPAEPECAAGAAVLAAAAHMGGCEEAIRRLVRLDRRVEPDPGLMGAYETAFQNFKDELHQRGYL